MTYLIHVSVGQSDVINILYRHRLRLCTIIDSFQSNMRQLYAACNNPQLTPVIGLPELIFFACWIEENNELKVKASGCIYVRGEYSRLSRTRL